MRVKSMSDGERELGRAPMGVLEGTEGEYVGLRRRY